VINKENFHIAVAQRQSNEFDIYYNGNRIDDAPKRVSNQYYQCKNFTVTYDSILIELTNLKEGEFKFPYRMLDINQ